MSRFLPIRGCPACAIIFWVAVMLVFYCAVAWWFLAEPTPAIDPHTPASFIRAPLNDE